MSLLDKVLKSVGLGGVARYREAGKKGDLGVANFGVVREDVLYRSAAPSLSAIGQLQDAYGIRTIVDLRAEVPPDRAQVLRYGLRRAYGIAYARIAMSDELGPLPDDVDRFLQILDDPHNWPVLVHCAGGRHRTGALCAVYRMEHDGWTNDQAYREAVDKHNFYAAFGHEPVRDFILTYSPSRAR
jgi:tyrosine-protein phosphatase SIW14